MNLSELTTEKCHSAGAELELMHHLTGEPTGVKIRIAGPDSKIFRKSEKEKNDEVLSCMMNDKSADLIQLEVNHAVAVTLGWSGIESNGDDLLFSADAAKDLYSSAPWILSQLNKFIGDRRNFTKG